MRPLARCAQLVMNSYCMKLLEARCQAMKTAMLMATINFTALILRIMLPVLPELCM